MQRSAWLTAWLVGMTTLVAIVAPVSPAQGLRTEGTGHPEWGQETVTVERAASFDLSVRASEDADRPAPAAGSVERPEYSMESNRMPTAASPTPFVPSAEAVDPLGPSPLTSASFAALLDNNTQIPPDTTGAVGPDHLMVTLNTEYRVQDRSGNVLVTVSGQAFWSGFTTISVFDPRVIYDPAEDRWVVVSLADARQATSRLLIAVSDTGDPTGTWSSYSIDGDAANIDWIDFPIVGFNDQWVVITANMFTIAGDSFSETKIYPLNKEKLYDGTFATVLTKRDTSAFSLAPSVTSEAGHDTMYLAENWGSGFLRVSSISGPVDTPVYTAGISFPSVASSWTSGLVDPDFAPQLGSVALINNGDARIGQPCTYRDGSLWCAQSVYLPAGFPTHTSVQWWEIDPTTGAVAQFGRIDDPTGQMFYAYPSIAVNQSRDVLIGYSRFSASQYAGAGYSFRYGNDPLSTLRDDTVLKAGEAPYFKQFSGTRNRWGDYSATVVDPNGNDMWTLQEYAATPSGGYDRWGTWWGKVSPGSQPPSWPGGSMIEAAEVLESTLTLTWSAAEDDRAVTGYRIVEGSNVVVPSMAQTTADVVGLQSATEYTFRVEAMDELGQWRSGPSVTVTMAQDFIDTEGTVFENDAAWMSGSGITKGCNPPINDMFCPDDLVTRGQMAAFLVRALGYTDNGGGNLFVDDDGSIFEDGIDRLGTAGVTRGCNPPINDMFCPDDLVTRGQMAAFLVRALGYTDNGGGNLFVDDDGSIFEDGIDRLGTAGVTRGCNPPINDKFCPDAFVTRGQMAAFLHRAL